MRRLLLFLFNQILFIVIVANLAFAQSGKIAGKVTDASTGEALPFVNIIVVGTTMGAASDIDGNYFIINISPGHLLS